MMDKETNVATSIGLYIMNYLVCDNNLFENSQVTTLLPKSIYTRALKPRLRTVINHDQLLSANFHYTIPEGAEITF